MATCTSAEIRQMYGLPASVRILRAEKNKLPALPPNWVVFPRGTYWLSVMAKKKGADVYDWYLDPTPYKDVIGEAYANHDMQVKMLKDVRIPSDQHLIFMKPLTAHKSLSGMGYSRKFLAITKKLARERQYFSRNTKRKVRMDVSYPWPTTLMLVARAKDQIRLAPKWRFWWVGGKLHHDLGDANNTLFKKLNPRLTHQAVDGIFRKLYRAGGQPIMTADFCAPDNHSVTMIEMNGPNFAGGMGAKTLGPVLKWLAFHGNTVKENLACLRR